MFHFSVLYGETNRKELHMPRKRGKVPSYCQHKASGQAVVRIDGVDHYLGPYGSPSSQDEYQRLVAEWLARKKEAAVPRAAVQGTRSS